MDTENISSSQIDNDPRLALSLERTELALERTHLAWIRTIIAVITSGFVIDKLLELLRHSRVVTGKALINQAHVTAILMTVTGIVLLIIECFYYVIRKKQLAARRNKKPAWFSIGVMLSMLIFIIGIAMVYLVLVTDVGE